jgi:dUTP pyrophosphatase
VTHSIDVPIVGGYLPAYAHPGDAGADLRASESLTLPPGDRATIGTGVSVAIPLGHVGFVVPRSGLAARHGITIVNSPGTVDAGYRGELRVTLLNTDRHAPFTVEAGDRIAQLVIVPIVSATFVPVDRHDETARGAGGFGSTGIRAMKEGVTE